MPALPTPRRCDVEILPGVGRRTAKPALRYSSPLTESKTRVPIKLTQAADVVRGQSSVRRSYHAAMVMPETLRTARLMLRSLGPEHVEVVHALFSSDGHTIGDGPVRDQAHTANWLVRRQMRYRTQGLAWYGLWRKGVFVGSCGVFTGDRCGDEPEIGYEVDVVHRGQGFAREAVHAVTEETHRAGHEQVWATIRPWNRPSAHIVGSAGYEFVRTETDAKGALDYYLSSAACRVSSTRV